MLSQGARDDTSPIRFEDVTSASGVAFRHFAAKRASLLPEDMGSGIALGDYDNDGLTDIFCVNFAGSIVDALPEDEPTARCRLYRNLGNMKFEDVTERSGLGLVAFGMGAAWGDYDNDGDLDLYVTSFGDNALFQQNPGGVFVEVTDRAGANDSRFSAGCSWMDYDRDGDLDLYVANYVEFTPREEDRNVASRQYGAGQPYTLNPSSYAPQPNALLRNNGDGTFVDVGVAVGVDDPTGRSLSATWVDMNNDGWADLYVANDVSNNGVFLNRGDGTFEDIGPPSLAADYRGAMGIAVSDFDNDLDVDLLITHWIAQENALFRNMLIDPMFDASTDSRIWFLDSADEVGLGQISLDAVGWATGFADFDNDGRRDLWIVNGSTFEQPENTRLLKPQRPFVFWNRQRGEYVNVASEALPESIGSFVGRGGAAADFDLDGRIDLAILVHGGELILLRNVSDPAGHYLRLRLQQRGGNSAALGARAYLSSGGQTQMAEVGAGSSYLSQNDSIVHFGLGEHDVVDSLRVVWPDGKTEHHSDLTADRTIVLVHDAVYPF